MNTHLLAISAALDALEDALDAAGDTSSIRYEQAQALFARADRLSNQIEIAILCAAPDYPEEEEE